MILVLLLCFALIEFVHPQFFKNSPQNVTITWLDPVMTIHTLDVQCKKDLNRSCFRLLLQLKNGKNMEWQKNIESSDCFKIDSLLKKIHCEFSHPNLDPEKCFHARLQFKTVKACGYNYESEWSDDVFMKNYSLVESCEEQKPKAFGVRNFIILFSAISALILLIIILLRCNMERMKSCVFPIVPDPKNSFHTLFDSHSGFFQEWVKTATNDIPQEEVDVMEDPKDEPVSAYVKENEVMMPVNQPVIEKQEYNATPVHEETPNVCFGNMNFTLNESLYVML
ncbi:hypothetical protein GDO81_005445 [Engystomops pustulosus]|uniref:Cytokine receptor-like factor 2-like D2 domain-containing protein n=1 Tax=Engystomops pustulosus TaxID=76066 RepID=A0AAV7CPF3_ENGPU|nr:hypothetical protein GDO81_005445 [Engystomops pustulosus]